MNKNQLFVLNKGYHYGVRPLLFRFPSEAVHEALTSFGQFSGNNKIITEILSKFFINQDNSIKQSFFGIPFVSPIGLSAGFDYRAELTQVTPVLGFGFETIGTITNYPYKGNSSPRLGRLVRSKSLLVNKGFKNEGIKKVISKLSGKHFSIPIGLSIGRTNSTALSTQKKSVEDICSAFTIAESSGIPFSYYELNISCPNLYGNISFYSKQNLTELLRAVTKLPLAKPLFIKMPIDKTNVEIKKILHVIVGFAVSGVIFGNLQKDRKDPALVQSEVDKYPIGNFSGKPTQKRSDELIAYAYKHFGDKLLIIGCGGVFSAEDAYQKIRRGASLIQLITGLIFVGPQLICEINCGLSELLKRDGFSHISEAIGIDVKSAS